MISPAVSLNRCWFLHHALCRILFDHSSNYNKWRNQYGVSATLVPIGFVPGLMVAPRIAEEEKDIDVLFIGE